MADLEYCPEVFGELVTDRGPGAYYNAADINRVGRAANCLAREMMLMGYPVTDELPTEWAMNDIYYDTDAAFLLAVLGLIKGQIASVKTGSFPSSMDGLDYNGANEIERFLLIVNDLLAAIKEAYPQCGVEQAGGVLI